MEFGTVLAGRYRVEGRLGEGGLAVVYRARHLILNSEVAVKVLGAADSRELRRRLLREGRVQAALRHPNVVAVFDVIEHDEGPALVMEYFPYGNLHTLVRETGGLPAPMWAGIGRGILAGVAAAHHHGVVHRDIKPANVLIDRVGEAIVPKVMDFGLAKAYVDTSPDAPAATRPGSVMGTPSYMSPEQTRDASSVDARSDVFSLGSTLYALAARRSPFTAGSDVETIRRVREAAYHPLGARRPDLPPGLVEVVEAALSPAPQDRYAHAGEMLRAWQGAGG